MRSCRRTSSTSTWRHDSATRLRCRTNRLRLAMPASKKSTTTTATTMSTTISGGTSGGSAMVVPHERGHVVEELGHQLEPPLDRRRGEPALVEAQQVVALGAHVD